ncbi:ATP-binding cassette domain-containing protein [Microbacterium sp. NPDC079995]|uniref:ABC transporter ATP-binding protein n=1 Tax=unclassified Microbacterium TaxID=2609290 RepID=UPI00344F134D
MIVAENAHVTYRVFASGKRVGGHDKLLSLSAVRGGRGLKSVHALRGVSFTANEGETIGVVGHNGSGKSTLFKAMSGLIPTSSGAIWARDRPVLLGVNAALVPELSGEDNIKLGLLAMGFSKAESAARVDEIADFAELNEFIHHPMRTYSSGMGARLRFAIASARAHSILLIDEALAVGDRKFRAKSEQRIRSLRDSAGLVMIVSHSVGSLRDSCERVLWVHKGELRADGPAGAVINDYVKWTKDPKSVAVGASYAQKPTTPDELQAESAPGNRKRRVAPTDAPPAGIEELFTSLSEPSGEATSSLPAESARTIARRERFRQNIRARRRRRITAVVATVVTLLFAIAAGAAIALLADASQSEGAAAPGAAPAVVAYRSPTIDSFVAAESEISCGDAKAGRVVLSWRVTGGAAVALASGPEVDALETPTLMSLPAAIDGYELGYPCAEESQAYTLTAEGEDGERTSSSVVVKRAPLDANRGIDPETVVPGTPEPGATPDSRADQTRAPRETMESDLSGPAPSPDPKPSTGPVLAPSPEPSANPIPEPVPTQVLVPTELPTEMPLPESTSAG